MGRLALVHGGYAWGFPLIIDTFIVLGEAALVIAARDTWNKRDKFWPWVAVLGGLAVSVSFNTGRISARDWTTHATAAIPPLAATVGLMIGLKVLKSVMKSSKGGKLAPEKMTPVTDARNDSDAPGPERIERATRRAPRAVKPRGLDAKRIKLEQMVRDNPQVSTNELATTVGLSWATADKWRKGVTTVMEN